MTPLLITPPTSPVVELSDLRDYMRIVGDDHDLMISSLERAAVAHLDGWTGVLGRCIMPQTWEIKLSAGRHILPFPDVIEATLYDGVGTEELPVELTVSGPQVDIAQAGRVRFTCAMPAHLLPAVQTAVKIWVGAAYDGKDVGDAFNALVSSLRWWQAQ